MARNKLAGTATGKSKSAKYYAANPEARAKKNAYNKEYHKDSDRIAYRSGLNAARRKAKAAGKVRKGQDMSHTSKGTYVAENRSKNRARNRGRKQV